MKQLSLGILAACLLLFLATTAFTHQTKTNHTRQASYYWFTYPDDLYNDYQTTANEEYELTLEYGVVVNTNPVGGTEVMRGYATSNDPHTTLPTVILYSH